MPELRMNAPVATRCGRWCAFTENLMVPSVLINDVQGEPRSAAAVYERGDFVPVHVIGDGFGQRPGESQPDQLGRPPVVELALVDDLVPGDRLDGLHVASGNPGIPAARSRAAIGGLRPVSRPGRAAARWGRPGRLRAGPS